MISRITRKGVVYAALLGILAASSLIGWSVVDAIRREAQQTIVPFGSVGEVFWLVNDFYRLRESVTLIATGAAHVNEAELELRVERLRARCELLRISDTLAPLREQYGGDSFARRCQQALAEIQTALPVMVTGNRQVAEATILALDEFRQPLQDLSAGLERLLERSSADVRRGFTEVLDRLDAFGTAAAAIMVTLLGLFAGEAWSAKRAERAIREREAELQFLAYHDPLTRLPNRRHMIEQLAATVARLEQAGGTAALLLIDLDGFKPVNDSYGHEAGDALLGEIAQRLALELRPGDFVARLGGDEFVLIIEAPPPEDGLGQLAARLIYVIEQPVDVAGPVVKVSASIGVARYPLDAATPDLLLHHADTALYAAKAGGRSRMCAFDAAMIEGQARRRIVEERLRHAITDGAIELFYQPQVQLRDGRIDAVEVLLRWQDEQLGTVSPAEFVPIAESIGFIAEIDRWVLAQAIRAAAAWEGPCAGLRIAVNLSARQFSQSDLAARVERELKAYGLAPTRLELEITEGAVLGHTAATVEQLRHLRALGVRIAVDDFGVGYSSLSYLKRLPLDQLKIDRSFVRDLEQDPHDRAIVQGIVGLGAALRLEVVAEGIETEAQRAFLAASGCQRGQGYLFARPMPEPALLAHVEAQARAEATLAARPTASMLAQCPSSVDAT